MLKNNFILFFIILSFIFSTPRWINDVSDSKNWVGIGIVNSNTLPPGSDPIQSAFNSAVKAIASQISIQIEASMSEEVKDSLYIDENGNAVSTFSKSFKNNLSAKVQAKLDGVKRVKADNDGINYYCKASLSMKKYWKDMERKRNEAIEFSKASLDKALNSDFNGSVFQYLDDALFQIFEFQGGVDNEFVSFGPPEITISLCPESGTKISSENNSNDDDIDDINYEKSDKEKIKEKYIEKQNNKFDDLRARSQQKLKEMRERIANYNNFGEKEEAPNNDSEDVPNRVVPIPSDIDSKKDESLDKNSKEIKSRVKDKDLEKFGIVVATHTQIISSEEDDCKKCLNSNSCDNPFSEDCECSEACGVAIAKEVCEEKTILLAPYIRQMLNDNLERINFTGDESKIQVKFGEKYDRISFRVTDSYLDNKSFKSLDELIEERENLIYRSPEWSKVQNLINQLLNNKKRHDDGIISLPLFNIPLEYCIGSNCSALYSDKSGYFDIDFPKYIDSEDPYLYITIDNKFFKSYYPLFPPFVKVPIVVNPMLIHIEITDINEWNDGLGYSLDSYLKQAFSDNKYSFTSTKAEADKFLNITSESEINEVGNDLYKVRHISSVSFSDETGVICEKVFKNKAKTCIGSSNFDLKNCASEAKKKLTKKFVKGLSKLEKCILSK